MSPWIDFFFFFITKTPDGVETSSPLFISSFGTLAAISRKDAKQNMCIVNDAKAKRKKNAQQISNS